MTAERESTVLGVKSTVKTAELLNIFLNVQLTNVQLTFFFFFFFFCFAARESREGARVGISAPKGKTKHSDGFNLSHISCTVFFILIYFKFPLNNFILILDLVYIYFCFCNLPKENVVRETEIQTLQRKVRKYKNSFQMYSKCRAQYSCMFVCFYLLSQEKPAREADMQTIQRKVTKEKKVWR